MFDNIKLSKKLYQVEALSPAYAYRGKLAPLGALPVYLNDRTRPFILLQEAEVMPLSTDRQMRGVRRAEVVVNKTQFSLFSVTDESEAGEVQLLQTHRPVIIYLEHVIVQGQLHVNADARDDDLLDETRDFHPLSGASIFPAKTLAVTPQRNVPLLFVNVNSIHAYHVHNA